MAGIVQMKVTGSLWGARKVHLARYGPAYIQLFHFESTHVSAGDPNAERVAPPVGPFGMHPRHEMVRELAQDAQAHDRRLHMERVLAAPLKWEQYVEIATTIVNALYPEPAV